MKPVQGLYHHVNCQREVVMTANMALLMSHNCLQLRGRKVMRNTLGQQQDGPEDSEHAWFKLIRTVHDPKGSTQIRRHRKAHDPANLSPTDAPPQETGHNATYPNADENGRKAIGRRRRSRGGWNDIWNRC